MAHFEPTIADFTEASMPAVSEFMRRVNFPDSLLKARSIIIRWRSFSHPLASAAKRVVTAEREGCLCGNLSLPDRTTLGMSGTTRYGFTTRS